MRSKTIFTMAISGLILFSSCKKESSAPIQPAVTVKKLDNITSPAWSSPVQFKYDEKGRLIESGNAQISQKYNFVNNSYSATFTDGNHFMYAEVQNGVLDKDGRLVSFTWVYRQPNQPDKHATYIFSYDGEGHLVKSVRTQLENGDINQDDYTWLNGNIMSYTDTHNGQPNIRIEYTYYDDLPNNVPIDLQDGIMNFYTDGVTGKRSKNLKKTKQVFNWQNVKTIDYLMSYTMNADALPSQIIIKDVNNVNNSSEMDLQYK